MSSHISKAIARQTKKSFGEYPTFIVESGKPSTSGACYQYIRAITDITGFACTDNLIEAGSGTYPTAFVAGTEFVGSYEDISVSTGKLFCKKA